MKDSHEDLSRQYSHSSNLDARRSFHERFSANKENWHDWVMRQMSLPAKCRILEIGCGSGELWTRLRSGVPAGWAVTLADWSVGMLDTARKRLGESASAFSFMQADVEDLPFADGSFDCVIANHMLYHARNVSAAIAELARVLRLPGCLYAATNGGPHMAEFRDLVRTVAPDIPYVRENPCATFCLENGQGLLQAAFADVDLKVFPGDLDADDADAVAAYIMSVPEASDFITRRSLN